MAAVNVWIGDCETLAGRCVFINRAFSAAFIAATCDCSAKKCFELIGASTLSEYQFGGGLTLSAQQTLGDSVDLHDPLLPGVSEEVKMVDECVEADVFFKLENTDIGGADGAAETYPFVLIGEPPTNLLAEEIGMHFVACGRANFDRCSETERFAPDSELHEVRCCSDYEKPDWVKVDSCDVWAQSEVGGACHHEKDFESAARICSDVGARLCTFHELAGDCTRGTGCAHDKDLIWSSTAKQARE